MAIELRGDTESVCGDQLVCRLLGLAIAPDGGDDSRVDRLRVASLPRGQSVAQGLGQCALALHLMAPGLDGCASQPHRAVHGVIVQCKEFLHLLLARGIAKREGPAPAAGCAVGEDESAVRPAATHQVQHARQIVDEIEQLWVGDAEVNEVHALDRL